MSTVRGLLFVVRLRDERCSLLVYDCDLLYCRVVIDAFLCVESGVLLVVVCRVLFRVRRLLRGVCCCLLAVLRCFGWCVLFPLIDCCLFLGCCLRFIVCCCVVCCSLCTVRLSLFVVRCSLFVVRGVLFVVCRLLFVVRCALCVVCCVFACWLIVVCCMMDAVCSLFVICFLCFFFSVC